ncbi:MAG: hypothetical protein Rhirs2KO_29840 [Rhizobiaceae bacterium]
MFDSAINSTTQAIQKIATKSVLSPALWLVGIAIIPLTYASTIETAYQEMFVWLLVAVIVFPMAAFIYFGIKNPDRLHSEDYLLENRRIEYNILGDEKNKSPKTIEGKLTANTHVERLGGDEK